MTLSRQVGVRNFGRRVDDNRVGTTENVSPPPSGRTLPRRDFFILPLIVGLTLLVMAGGAEMVARAAYPIKLELSCTLHTAEGMRFPPFCVAFNKVVDGPWVENRFNDCGYRTAQSCRVTPLTRRRVAVVGSSIARGHGVPYPETFAARASAALSHACGETVDFQNLGNDAADILRLDRRMPEALALKPRVIVMLITTTDLQHMNDDYSVEDQPPPRHASGLSLIQIMDLLRESHLFLIGQHFLYRDPAVQVTAFTRNGVDDMNGYVVDPLPPKWQTRVDEIAALLKRMTAVTTPAGVKVVLVYVPRRVHAVLKMPRYADRRLNARVLDQGLAAAARASGVDFLDTTPDFAAARDFNSLFYLADGHPSGGGHAVIAKAVETRLLQTPAFQSCRAGGSSGGTAG